MRCACQGKIGGLKRLELDEFGGRIGLTGLSVQCTHPQSL